MHFGFKVKLEFERCNSYRNYVHIFIIATSHSQQLERSLTLPTLHLAFNSVRFMHVSSIITVKNKQQFSE